MPNPQGTKDMRYGTGAVMGAIGEDQRDREFAECAKARRVKASTTGLPTTGPPVDALVAMSTCRRLGLVGGRRGEAGGSREIYLAEYNRLRDEIDSSRALNYGFIGLQLAALGGTIAAFDSFPDVALGAPILSIVLWMLWSDLEAHVWKLSAYICLELAPRLAIECPGVLGWDLFLHRVDAGGDKAREALYLAGPDQPAPPRWKTRIFAALRHDPPERPPAHRGKVGFYGALLLGGGPLLLIPLAASRVYALEDGSTLGVALRAVLLCLTAGLWLAGLVSYRRSRDLKHHIDLAIMQHRQPAARS